MTAADGPGDATGIVPRWEWRTFGDLDPEATAELPARLAPEESEETYLLSQSSDASVKIRGGQLDVKVLRRVDPAGLQLWVPTLKATFPVHRDDVAAALTALGVAVPELTRSHYDHDALLREVVGDLADLRAVAVWKSRHRRVVGECLVEDTDIRAGEQAARTIAVESPSPAAVIEVVDRLRLAGRRNTCVARGLRQLVGWQPERVAALDVGTNSVKLVCGHRGPDRTVQIDRDSVVVTRLGEGLAQTGELAPEAVRRTTAAITELVEEARRDGSVDLAAVGTAGLRQASNAADLLDAVRDACGVTVQVITGEEESRLAYLAAVSTLPSEGRLLVFDSGGGSSQFTFGRRESIEDRFSLDVGAVLLTERFGLHDAVPRDTIARALAAIASDLRALSDRPRPDAVIAIGGTATNLAAVRHGLAEYDANVVHGTALDLAEIDRQIEVYRRRTATERGEIVGLQPSRAEVILAGACIVRSILDLVGRDTATVSDRGLRHGLLAERLAAGHAGGS